MKYRSKDYIYSFCSCNFSLHLAIHLTISSIIDSKKGGWGAALVVYDLSSFKWLGSYLRVLGSYNLNYLVEEGHCADVTSWACCTCRTCSSVQLLKAVFSIQLFKMTPTFSILLKFPFVLFGSCSSCH